MKQLSFFYSKVISSDRIVDLQINLHLNYELSIFPVYFFYLLTEQDNLDLCLLH
jgi:hypothetical protein